jgi:hypothetical protein
VGVTRELTRLSACRLLGEEDGCPVLARDLFGLFNAPSYSIPNSFMYEVRSGCVDVADYHKAECNLDPSCEYVNHRKV